jgi:DNA-binding SARP family transcriptional activator/tetratricopeptide (TPR) repeat protein
MAVPSEQTQGRSAELRFGVLGGVWCSVGGTPVAIGSPGAQALLMLLLRGANQVLPIERIIAGLWTDEPPATARTIVHGYVSRLRRCFGELDPAGETVRLLTRPPGYQLLVDESLVDLYQVRRLLSRARGRPAAERAELLRRAADLWTGPTPVRPPAESVTVDLEELRLVVAAERIEAELELGHHADLIGELRLLVAEHPYDEGLVGQLIRALYGAGQRVDALACYRDFHDRVADELGIDPGPRLLRLYEMLLRDDPGLRGEPAVEPPPTPAHLAPAQLPPAATAFTGRTEELAWLDGLLAVAPDTLGVRVAVVTGAPGVGKSALALTWGHRVSGRFPDGVLYAALRGFDPGHAPREAGDVLPRFLLALGLRAEELPADAEEQASLYRTLLAARRVLVVLDDARDSEHVRPLLPSGPGSLVLVTSRRRLDGLIARSGARLLPLATLPPAQAVGLITAAARDGGAAITAAQAAELARLCDRLPLALRVIAARLTVRPGQDVAALVAELADERTRLSTLDVENADTSVRAALDVSYRGLHPAIGSAFRMLGLAPTSSVDPYLVAALCGTDVPCAGRRLRALAEANLIAEAGGDRFVLHDLVRLHARGLAETELSAGDADVALGRLLAYYRATADGARRLLHPPRDDLDMADRYPASARPALATAEQAVAWFDTEWPNLDALLETTVAAGRHLDAWHLVLLTSHYLGARASYANWSRWARIGLASARVIGDVEGEVLMLIVLAVARSRFGRGHEALDDAQLALRLATDLGDPRHIRTALGTVASGLFGQDRFREALACDQESYQLSVDAGDLMGQAHALNNMSQVEQAMGQRTRAAEHVAAAVELFARIGDVADHLLALNNLIELRMELGQLDEAERLARQALDRAAERAPDLQTAFAQELHGRVLLARGDPAARAQLAAALRESEAVGAPRAADLAELLRGLPADDPPRRPELGV